MAASNNRRLTVTVKPNSGHTLFRYTAKDIDGKVVRGAMEAADYDTLYTQLLAQGLYLQSADKEKIDEIFARAAQKSAPMVCFQCADDTVYQEVYRLLIEEQGIFAYLPESETTAAYLDSDRERTFYFWFTEVS